MTGDVRMVMRLPGVIQLTRVMPLFFRHRLAHAGFLVLAVIAMLSLFGPLLF